MSNEQQYKDLCEHLINLCKKTQDKLNIAEHKLNLIQIALSSEIKIQREGIIKQNESE